MFVYQQKEAYRLRISYWSFAGLSSEPLNLPPGRMARPLHRTAPALDRPARQGLQADEAGRRLLARRSAEPAAPAHLQHLLAQREGAEGLSPPSRGGREARPSAARPRDGPVPYPGGGSRESTTLNYRH